MFHTEEREMGTAMTLLLSCPGMGHEVRTHPWDPTQGITVFKAGHRASNNNSKKIY